MSGIIPTQSALDTRRDFYDRAIAMTLETVSPSSRRVYTHVFDLWEAFCEENAVHPLELSFEHVTAFLKSSDAAKSTKQRRLSILRSLASNFALLDPDNAARWQAAHTALLKVKVSSQDSTDSGRRTKALTPREVYDAFDAWPDDKLTHIRNRALLAVAFYAGLRRSEIAALTWDDIDLDAGQITVKHGKGDKDRTTPLLSEDAVQHLQLWKHTQEQAATEQRDYVFCAIRNRGEGELREDKPMTTTAIYHVMQASGDFAPHDARRTLITSLLNAGTSVSDAQFIAGHSQPQTTLRYAKVSDANAVKGRAKLDY